MKIYKLLLKVVPELKFRITIARIHLSPEEYVKKLFLNSFFIGLLLCIVVFFFTKNPYYFFLTPILMILVFLWLVQYPTIRAYKLAREIDKEIVYAGRFLVIEMESGMTLYDAMNNLAKNYEKIGAFFREIVEKIDLGSSIEDAINDSINLSPSRYFKRILWQVLNSIKTGADISSSLKIVLDQIVREQNVEITEYGRRLNPLAMFYMIFTIILPSLGTLMFIVLNTIIGIQITLSLLLTIAGIVGFIQFLFLAIIKQGRPSVEI